MKSLLPFSEEMDVFGMRCRVLTLEGLIKRLSPSRPYAIRLGGYR
jgi:hypothetical protein